MDHPDGVLATNPIQADQLEQQGYVKCRNRYCDFYLHPDTHNGAFMEQGDEAVYQCPHCGLSQHLAVNPRSTGRNPNGGMTPSGLYVGEFGQIGEDLVRNMGTIPGYGPIQWWHTGPASSNSALDGATFDWGIEVKTADWSSQRKRGIMNPNDKRLKARAINDPSLFAAEINDPALDRILDQLNFKGLLGVLVLLDFDREAADIFAHEMPKTEGRLDPSGIKHITRKVVLAENVPFQHSLPNPQRPGFVPFYQQQAVTHEPF